MSAVTSDASRKSVLGPIGEICECRPTREGITDLWASSGLFLKPVAKISITVSIPFVKGKEGSRVVSNSEVLANIKKLVTPREFKNLKILKETNTFLRYLGEIEEKKDLPIFVSKLNGSFIQLKSFASDAVFKLNAAEYDVIVPKQNDWVSHFSKMIGSDEDKPGLRPDTILLSGVPCAWFSNYHREKQKAIKEFERKRERRKKERLMRNRRRQRGSPVSSSSTSDEFASSSTDSAEEEELRKKEQQKKILLQFQSGEYKNTAEGKSYLHTKNEVHQIYKVDGKITQSNRRRSDKSSSSKASGSRSSSSGSRTSRSRSDCSRSSSSGSSASNQISGKVVDNSRASRKRNKYDEALQNKISKPTADPWKKNAFVSVDNGERVESLENEKENMDQESVNRTAEVVPEDEETKRKRLDKEAKSKARHEFRKRPWLNLPVPDKPEESMVRRVFELFGRIRRIEIPLLRQLDDGAQLKKKRTNESRGIGVFNFDSFEAQCDAADVTTFKTFDVYIQYETYLGFNVAMNALRGKRMYYRDLDERAYVCTFKVDFDGTGYLSDRKIQQRKLERFKQLHRDEIVKDLSGRPKYENRLGGKHDLNSYNNEFASRMQLPRNKSSSRLPDGKDHGDRSRKRHSAESVSGNTVSDGNKRLKREKVAFPMPKALPKSVLYEMSQSRARKDKSESSVMGPALPKRKEDIKERRITTGKDDLDADGKRHDSILMDLDDVSSEEETTPGLYSNTEIDRLLKEALKVKSGKKRRLVVLELLRRLQIAKEARVQLVAKRKAQAVILVHAIFERIKHVESVILDRRVEAVEQVRLRQIEQERLTREQQARREALKALKHKQKLNSHEVEMREKIVKRTLRKKDLEDLDRRDQLRKQVGKASDRATSPVLRSLAVKEARHSVRRHGFKPDKAGHEEDKVVGFTAPEKYSHFVEYMREMRPNFVGSAIVTNFVAEETPKRTETIRSHVVPTQCPVPRPLDEIIKSKQFETDSESSCDDADPTHPATMPSDRSSNRNGRRNRMVDLDDDSLYRVDATLPLKKDSNSRASRKFTDADFKVPDLPLAYREKQNSTPKSRHAELLEPKSVSVLGKGNSSVGSVGSKSCGSDSDDDIEGSVPKIIEPPKANPAIPSDSSSIANRGVTPSNVSRNSIQKSKCPVASEVQETLIDVDESKANGFKRRNAVEDIIISGGPSQIHRKHRCLIDEAGSAQSESGDGNSQESEGEDKGCLDSSTDGEVSSSESGEYSSSDEEDETKGDPNLKPLEASNSHVDIIETNRGCSTVLDRAEIGLRGDLVSRFDLQITKETTEDSNENVANPEGSLAVGDDSNLKQDDKFSSKCATESRQDFGLDVEIAGPDNQSGTTKEGVPVQVSESEEEDCSGSEDGDSFCSTCDGSRDGMETEIASDLKLETDYANQDP